MKAKTLRDILYKDRHCRIETIIDVDEKDVEKLVRIGAIQCLEAIPEAYKPEPKVKINVIKNPIKVEKKIEEKKVIEAIDKYREDRIEKVAKEEEEKIELPRRTAEKIYKEDKRIKRKYNKRSKNFGKRRF